MGPGVDPHLYRATENDVMRLRDADIVFYNGLHLESKMGEILEKLSGEKQTVPVAEGIQKSKLLSPKEYEGLYDPHVWFDVQLWMEAAKAVEAALVALDPTHRSVYETQARTYLAELKRLDEDVRALANSIPKSKRVLVTAHDAFNYFATAYGFEVRGLQGLSTQAEAGIEDVRQLAAFISQRQIPAIFVESSVPKRNIEAVQKAVQAKGWETRIGGELFSDAMGDAGTEEGTYIGMVRHNIHTIVAALTKNNYKKEQVK